MNEGYVGMYRSAKKREDESKKQHEGRMETRKRKRKRIKEADRHKNRKVRVK
jgi:hypothetical protein